MQFKPLARTGSILFFTVSALLVSCSSKHPEMATNEPTPPPSAAMESTSDTAAQPEPQLVAQNTNLGASSSGYSR